MHNMKIADCEKCARDTKYAKPNEQTKHNKENLPESNKIKLSEHFGWFFHCKSISEIL